MVRALDERHLAAEACHDLRELDADRTTAEDEHAVGHGLHPGRLAVRPDPFELAEARDRGDDRIGARGQDHVVGGVPHTVHLDDADAGQPSAAAKERDVVVRQPAFLAGIRVVRDHEVTPREDRVDVDLRPCRRVPCGVDRLAGTKQRLRRDARPVGALAPDQLPLDERDPEAALGKRTGAVLAGRAAADDDHVVVAAHRAASSMCRPASVAASSCDFPCSRATM